MREWESGSVREGEKDEIERVSERESPARAANLIEKKDVLSLRLFFQNLFCKVI